jgi:hypothetical protein
MHEQKDGPSLGPSFYHSRQVTPPAIALFIRRTAASFSAPQPPSTWVDPATESWSSQTCTILKLICVRTIHRDNSARAIILKLDCNLKPSHPVAASIRLPPIFYSLARHRRPASLVPRRADPRRRPLDRPANHRSAHPAPLSGLDSPRALSRTLQVHST